MSNIVRKEVRICLIMYGGVSLAIYMNGVAREFFELVRGRRMWGLLKLLSDVDVSVDITSGASAGGINGLYLAYALCNEMEFGPLARLWREKAGLDILLQNENDAEARSLLRSDYMKEELANSLRAMTPVLPDKVDNYEIAPNSISELDCFMAVTKFDGYTWQINDSRNTPITLKSYRGVTHFRHRKGRKEPFNPTANPDEQKRLSALDADTLASVARATSAFPFAFQAQLLDGARLADRFAGVRPPLQPDETAWFVDGGVLDNRPFGPAIAEIYKRHALHPVDRLLFYVEPDPADRDTGRRHPKGGPNVINTALASLVSLPAYESIAGDIEDLNKHNQRVSQFNAIFDPVSLVENRSYQAVNVAQREVYTRARLHAMIQAALTAFTSDQISSLLNDLFPESGGASINFSRVITRVGEEFERIAARQEPGYGYTNDPLRLNAVDLEFVKRAYYYWNYRLHARMNEAFVRNESTEEILTLIEMMNERIDLILYLEAALAWELQNLKPPEGRALRFEDVFETYSRIFRGDPDLDQWVGGASAEPVGKAIQMCRQRGPAGDSGPRLLLDLLQFLDQHITPGTVLESKAPNQEPVNIYQAIDAYEFPARLIAGLGEMDRVEYYRISPLDTVVQRKSGRGEVSIDALKKWNAEPMTKVTGRSLGHFGAFLKKSWRSNDIMFGRLDSATVVWDVLFQQRGLRLKPALARELVAFQRGQAGQSPQIEARLTSDGQRRALRAYLDANPDLISVLDAFASAPTPQDLEKAEEDLKVFLLQTYQREILAEEIPLVISDAFEEEVRRQQTGRARSLRQRRSPKAAPASYDEAAHQVLEEFKLDCKDPLLQKVAANVLQQNVTNAKTALTEFVGRDYAVGSEQIRDLDSLSTAITGLQAARVAFNLVKGVLVEALNPTGEDGKPGKKSSLADKVQRFVLDRLSILVTTLHLGAKSVRDGSFPAIWGFLVGVSVLLLVLRFFVGEAGDWPDWPTLYAPIGLLALLLFAPGVWFGGQRFLRFIRWPILIGLLAMAVIVLFDPVVQFATLIFGGLVLLLIAYAASNAGLAQQRRKLEKEIEALEQKKSFLETP